MRLLRQLMRRQMIALPMSRRCSLMSMGSLVMELSSAVVNTLWHMVSPVFRWMHSTHKQNYRPIHPPSTVSTVPVT